MMPVLRLGKYKLAGNAVVGPVCFGGPVIRRRLRHHRLIQHAGDVDRLGRHRRQPQPKDAPGEQVLDHRELNRNPSAGDGLHRENVQVLGIEDRVLPGPRRP
jgi:hypothetical protein